MDSIVQRFIVCDAVLSVHSRFAIILLMKRQLVVLLQPCSCYRVVVCVLYLFLSVTYLDWYEICDCDIP